MLYGEIQPALRQEISFMWKFIQYDLKCHNMKKRRRSQTYINLFILRSHIINLQTDLWELYLKKLCINVFLLCLIQNLFMFSYRDCKPIFNQNLSKHAWIKHSFIFLMFTISTCSMWYYRPALVKSQTIYLNQTYFI